MSIEFVAVRLKSGSNLKAKIYTEIETTLIHNPVVLVTDDIKNNFFMLQMGTNDTPPTSNDCTYDGESVWRKRYVKSVGSLQLADYNSLITHGRGSFCALITHKSAEDLVMRSSNDPLGLYPLCYYVDDNIVAVGNNPRLIASYLLQRFDVQLKKGPNALVNELLTATHLNDAPYEGMRYLPFDNEIIVNKRGDVFFKRKLGDSFYYSKDEDAGQLLDASIEEISENVAALADAPYNWKICDITGGMDSRLVLAAILKTGRSKDFYFNVFGRLPSPDVNIAHLLMKDFGLQKIRIVDEDRKRGDILQEMRTFSYIAGGAKNNIDRAWTSLIRNDELFLVGGGNSGYYKGLYSRRLSNSTVSDAVSLLISNSALVEDEHSKRVKTFVHDELKRWMEVDCMTIGSALNRFYVEYRVRYVIGLCEHWGRMVGGKAHPLYSPSVMRLGFRVPENDRNNDRLTYLLLEKMFPALLHYPLEGRVWPIEAYKDSDKKDLIRKLPAVTRDSLPLVPEGVSCKTVKVEYPAEAKQAIRQYAPQPPSKMARSTNWRKLQVSKGRKWHWTELEDIRIHAQTVLRSSGLTTIPGFRGDAVDLYLKQDLTKLTGITQVLAFHNICMGAIFHGNLELPLKVYSPLSPVQLKDMESSD